MDGHGGEAAGELQQGISRSLSVSEGEEESEGADSETYERDSHTHYIAIQRNSKYYRSMRLPNRSKRKTAREAMHAGRAAGSLKNNESVKEPLNVLPPKGSPAPVDSNQTTLELLIQSPASERWEHSVTSPGRTSMSLYSSTKW